MCKRKNISFRNRSASEELHSKVHVNKTTVKSHTHKAQVKRNMQKKVRVKRYIHQLCFKTANSATAKWLQAKYIDKKKWNLHGTPEKTWQEQLVHLWAKGECGGGGRPARAGCGSDQRSRRSGRSQQQLIWPAIPFTLKPSPSGRRHCGISRN